jgi:cell fate (sporulation/competence/biofilm development) regulator YlbF (YheA/YmcA/DUF963 family)
MNLDSLAVLRSASIGMMDGSMLGPREGYELASSITFGLALGIVADQLENAVADLTEENAAMREIFEKARTVAGSGDAELLARLEAAATSTDSDLRVSALREANDTLRQLLGDLLASVEESTSDALRALEHRIWVELNKSTERRSVPLGPF